MISWKGACDQKLKANKITFKFIFYENQSADTLQIKWLIIIFFIFLII